MLADQRRQAARSRSPDDADLAPTDPPEPARARTSDMLPARYGSRDDTDGNDIGKSSDSSDSSGSSDSSDSTSTDASGSSGDTYSADLRGDR